MKLSDVNVVVGILGGIKINRIEDKEAKAALLKNFLALRKVAKEAEADRNEIVRKFQEDWADVLPVIQALRDKNAPVVGHDDYLDAENDANKAILDIFSARVDVDLSPVKTESIIDFSGDITLEQIAFMQECGIIE